MTFLVAFEGADGAGKATAAAAVRDGLISNGFSACVVSFPRYQDTVAGIALGNFLSGRTPVKVTAKAAAVLYAMDRFESVDFVREVSSVHEVVLFDRYLPSNMVYQASKVPDGEADAFMDWILNLEIKTFGIIPPDLCIYLNTPLDHAQRLMLLKQRRSYTDRQHDEHEADLALQRRVRMNYASLAMRASPCPWHVVETVAQGALRTPADISQEIVSQILAHRDNQPRDGNFSRMTSRA